MDFGEATAGVVVDAGGLKHLHYGQPDGWTGHGQGLLFRDEHVNFAAAANAEAAQVAVYQQSGLAGRGGALVGGAANDDADNPDLKVTRSVPGSDGTIQCVGVEAGGG